MTSIRENTNIGIDKATLREFFRQERVQFTRRLSPATYRAAFAQLPETLLVRFAPGRVVVAYVALGAEADPTALLTIAHRAGCRTGLVAMASRNAPIKFRQWVPGDPLTYGPFAMQQPPDTHAQITPDIVIVPLLAFAPTPTSREYSAGKYSARKCKHNGYTRLGQGGGHYDRALAQLPQAEKIGLAWSVQQAASLPCESHDIPLTAVLTEQTYFPTI